MKGHMNYTYTAMTQNMCEIVARTLGSWREKPSFKSSLSITKALTYVNYSLEGVNENSWKS